MTDGNVRRRNVGYESLDDGLSVFDRSIRERGITSIRVSSQREDGLAWSDVRPRLEGALKSFYDLFTFDDSPSR